MYVLVYLYIIHYNQFKFFYDKDKNNQLLIYNNTQM